MGAIYVFDNVGKFKRAYAAGFIKSINDAPIETGEQAIFQSAVNKKYLDGNVELKSGKLIEIAPPVNPEVYKLLRRAEYPEIGDQLDAIWEMLTPPAGSKAEVVKQKIEAVKTKYPQPKE